MDDSKIDIDSIINRPDFEPQQQGARFWYEAYLEQCQGLEQTQKELQTRTKELEDLKETLRKLSERSSENSSQPSSQDGYKKKSKPKNFSNPPQKYRFPTQDAYLESYIFHTVG